MLMKVSATARAAKFLIRMGCRARSAMSNPLRTPTARASAVLPNISASRIKMRPASTRRSVRTSRSAFDRGIIQCYILLDLGQPSEVGVGRDQLRGAAQLVDRVPDSDGADPGL